MRWVLAVLVLTSCSSFAIRTPQTRETPVTCHSYLVVVPVVDLAAGIVAAGLAIAFLSHEIGPSDHVVLPAAIAGSVATSYLLSSGYGLHAVMSCPERRRAHVAWQRVHDDTAAQDARKAAGRESAWQLTKRAQAAARTGDCTTALQLGVDVDRLDPELHAMVYERDAAIAACKASP